MRLEWAISSARCLPLISAASSIDIARRFLILGASDFCGSNQRPVLALAMSAAARFDTRFMEIPALRRMHGHNFSEQVVASHAVTHFQWHQLMAIPADLMAPTALPWFRSARLRVSSKCPFQCAFPICLQAPIVPFANCLCFYV